VSKHTDDLVDRFAVALKEKLAAAEQKYGYDDTWREDDWRDDLVEKLQEHVLKGDPRDVAAYCAFAWHHGWSVAPLTPAPRPVREGLVRPKNMPRSLARHRRPHP